MEEGGFVNGRKEGQWVNYFEDGKAPKLKGSYSNNRPDGEFIRYYKNGKIKEKGSFSKSKLKGEYIRYHSNGNIEYVLEGASEYKVEYLSHDPFEAVNHWNDFNSRRLELLKETDWSQISDAEISTEERRLYKEYRKYIRRKNKEYTTTR